MTGLGLSPSSLMPDIPRPPALADHMLALPVPPRRAFRRPALGRVGQFEAQRAADRIGFHQPQVEPLAPTRPEEREPRERPQHTPRATGARAPDAQELTRAFRRQQGKIEGCFKQHAAAIQGLPTLQLEFALDAAGKLTAVRVTPEALAVTALGQCIKKVAGETHFPAQGKAVSFAIPLSASRSGT